MSPRPLKKSVLRRSPLLAAIDLGSNSFHMVIARLDDGSIRVVDRLQEMTRLADGLDRKGRLTRIARERALACLSRFGQRLRGVDRVRVRAVGTNALRRARDARSFLPAAQKALGFPIEVISGREEARLIYQGVSAALSGGDRCLVVDIGGGSTELILGRGRRPLRLESLYMGAVSASQSFFPDGRITGKRMQGAEAAARLELEPVCAQFREGWEVAIGSAGTVRAAIEMLRERETVRGVITRTALDRLRAAVIKAGSVARLRLLPGLGADRAPVFAGGLAVLVAVFDALGIDRMQVSDRALREGILEDLVGRMRRRDVRAATVRSLAARYGVDWRQATRVQRSALDLFDQVASAWIPEPQAVRGRTLLSFAASLHEIGLSVAHAQYHKHGAYLVAHSDMPGFSLEDQRWVATFVRGHRRKFPVVEFENALRADERDVAQRLCVLLRLSVLLHRARAANGVAVPEIRARGGRVTLRFAKGYLKAHPLTALDLERERDWCKVAGIGLSWL